MWIKYVINSRRKKNRRKSLSISVYTSSSITTTTTKMAEREKEEDFHQNIVVSFSTYGNPSGKCVRGCVFVWVLGADFIASTNLSPNFIKAKNGIFVTSTVCLQWRYRIRQYGNVKFSISHVWAAISSRSLSPYPFLCWHLCSHKRRIFYTMLNSISLYFRTANNE